MQTQSEGVEEEQVETRKANMQLTLMEEGGKKGGGGWTKEKKRRKKREREGSVLVIFPPSPIVVDYICFKRRYATASKSFSQLQLTVKARIYSLHLWPIFSLSVPPSSIGHITRHIPLYPVNDFPSNVGFILGLLYPTFLQLLFQKLFWSNQW